MTPAMLVELPTASCKISRVYFIHGKLQLAYDITACLVSPTPVYPWPGEPTR
ncbi:hypothetical protein Snas_1547 [Stackebrandtia nassauensis DSM 44728]|uniref:Uncharacterized protein n=1 Tax=Stackebrandtia nassauensis (strain DSM 44728 / CIP 108903 / NRRL B-16338 / NBRC 102104 / LLR-40K-21) TaxID=446470 RepID=D3PW93_STANL|nr:hypothetical protein Snas_1547 [Stackebrandtia nassauensis DSM 44728]